MRKPSIVFILAAFTSLSAAAQCYTVYNDAGRAVYQGREAPVDMSRPLHETVPVRFPGGHLVFGADAVCNQLWPLQPLVQAPDTATLGAGPAQREETVITELRNPPLRVIRRGKHLTIEGLNAVPRSAPD